MVDLRIVLRSALTAAAALALLDAVWLGLLMGPFYRSQLAPIARLSNDGRFTPLWGPALVVYVLLAVGLAVFVAPRAGSLAAAVALGGLFGVISFGVYDLTNYATLAAFPRVLVLVDIAWGACSCAAAAAVIHLVGR